MNVKQLLASAGDIPEGIKAVLRQRNLTSTGRDEIEAEVDDWEMTFTGEDALDGIAFDPEVDDA